MKARSLVVISGLSGSGKSTALKAFEDQGYKCVDNLPAEMLKNYTSHLLSNASDVVKDFAILIDFIEPKAFSELKSCIETLKQSGVTVNILFFDAQDEILIRRYRETRRPHPLIKANASSQTVAQAVHSERELYSNIRIIADRVIDTSLFSNQDLRKVIEDFVGKHSTMRVFFTSFGFKYGILQDADMVIDVRFLPNPFYDIVLKPLTGLELKVKDYVFKTGEAQEFINRYSEIINFLLPKFLKEGKQYLTIGIGCTGGKHRSVAISEALSRSVSTEFGEILVQHRDINR